MCALTEKKLIDNYDEYCLYMDNAQKLFDNPVSNSFMLADQVRQMIAERSIFILEGENALSVLVQKPSMYLLSYYADADKNIDFKLDELDKPVIIDQVSTSKMPVNENTKRFINKNGFVHIRTNHRLMRNLSEIEEKSHKRNNIKATFANKDDLEKVLSLLKMNFDMYADRLPATDKLEELILSQNVFVLREQEKIIAASIRIPGGRIVNTHWIVTDEKFRGSGLGPMLLEAEDKDSKTKGYKYSTMWINIKSVGWINAVKKLGYYEDGHIIDTYIKR